MQIPYPPPPRLAKLANAVVSKATPSGSEFESQIEDTMKTLTTETFDDAVRGVGGHVVVDFYADWCGPCQKVSSALNEIEQELDSISFFKVESDKNPDLTRKFNVMSIPTLVILKDGLEKKRLVGAKSKADLLEDLSDL